MANTIKIKRSAVPAKAPTTSDLALGELALNTYDGKLYTKKDDGTASIVELSGGGGSVTIDTTAADVLGVSGSAITADDAGADKLVFWDDSAGKLTHLALGTNLSITDTTLDATGGGGSSAGVDLFLYSSCV
jgi:hypothetical protein